MILRLLLLLLCSILTGPGQIVAVQAQEAHEGSEEAEAVRRDRLARADSVRDALDRPPGKKGVTPTDLALAPFHLVGGALGFGFSAGFGAYELLRDFGVLEVPDEHETLLGGANISGRLGDLGSRSHTAAILTFRGLRPFYVEGGYSVRHYERYEGGFQLGRRGRGLHLAAVYHDLKEPHFWGIGPGTPADARADYARERVEVSAGGWGDLGTPVEMAVEVAWQQNVVERGSDDDVSDLQDVVGDEPLFGLRDQTEYFRIDAAVDADLTRLQGLHKRGLHLLAGTRIYRGLDGTDSDFVRLRGDVRYYRPVSPHQSVALRGWVVEHVAEEGRGVPFTHLARLGEDNGLRGFREQRFQDRAVASLSVEWRWEVWWYPSDPDQRVEAFLFAEGGTVASSLDRLRSDEIEVTPGLGFRLLDSGEGIVEAYLAFGGDERRLDLSFGKTF